MYIPYLRARQFELVALCELLEQHKIGKEILPLVEPIKLTPTLVLTIEAFVESKHPIAVICNPTVGSYTLERTIGRAGPLSERFDHAMSSEFVQKVLVWDTKGREYLTEWEKNGFDRASLMVILQDKDALDLYMDEFAQDAPKYVLVPDQGVFRRTIGSPKIILQDQFKKQKRNTDLSIVEDESFSDAPLFYKEEGYVGFADYSIIGDELSEGGFAPYAASIHLVYFDGAGKLRIRHFVSGSVEDMQDSLDKFFEAVHKLAEWVAVNNSEMTIGLETLLQHHKEGTYQGWGVVKKLSIMHHLELMSVYMAK